MKMLFEKNLRITISFYKKLCPPVITWKNNYRTKLYQYHTHWRKSFLELLLWKVCESLLQTEEKTCIVYIVLCESSLVSQERENGINTVCKSKFFFLYYLFWCTKVKIYHDKWQLKMLVVFLPIFVADTKINFGYSFVATLRIQ